MKIKTLPQPIDKRRKADIQQLLLARLPGHLPQWQPVAQSAGQGALSAAAQQIETILLRLNQVPAKQKLAFLDTLGISLIPAQPARAPIVFRLSEDAADARAPQGTQVVAPPPPDSTQQIVFETEQTVGLAAAKLTDVVSLWPGRDSFIDHSQAHLTGSLMTLFASRELEETPHYLYIAHQQLLALDGQVELEASFDIFQPSSEHLGTIWEYWDGEVWRGFVNDASGDATSGWRQSGRFLLVSDCAESKPIEVNGIEANWIRGRLNEPLPPEPAQTLPLVDGIELRSIMKRPLHFKLEKKSADTQRAGKFVDANETPIPFLPLTDSIKTSDVGSPEPKPSLPVAVQISDSQTSNTVEKATATEKYVFTVNGLAPDQAMVEDSPVDVSKPFYPLGAQPQPGSAFYFTHEAIFAKPGAKVQLYLQLASTPQNAFSVDPETESDQPPYLAHTVVWEYWNGRQWNLLDSYSNSGAKDDNDPRDFTGSGVVEFSVPLDMATTTVNDEEAVWLRVRLTSGGYGQRQKITWNNNPANIFSYVMPRPPALAMIVLGYTWQYGPFKPDHVLAYNDFQHLEVTEEARRPGRPFAPFAHLADQTAGLYLGFDKKLPVDRISLYWQIDEDPDDPRGPALIWEYWDGFNWRDLAVQDETNHLRVPGMLSFISPADSQAYVRFMRADKKTLPRFGNECHWIRGRLKTDGPPGEAEVRHIFTNAVWASQQQTVTNEPLGVSSGRLNQIMQFRQYPILPDEIIEVRELSGPRANVEWRILLNDLFAGDTARLQKVEDQLRADSPVTEIREGDALLMRNRDKKVTEVWVRWQHQPVLLASGAEDRHYTLNHTTGQLQFGDGQNGRIPPATSQIRAARFRAGGGRAGNVAAEQINQQLAGIGGVEALFNPVPAEGGADAETIESVAWRGPLTVRHQGHAISAIDYETMAYEASAAVAVAHAQPLRDHSRVRRPGRLTLTIIPWSEAERPWPTFGLRQQVLRYLAAHAPADLAAADKITVTGPNYQPVNVMAVLTPQSAENAGIVDQAVRAALRQFFHPLFGGPHGAGWKPGQAVYLSDVAARLGRVPGIDAIQSISMTSQAILQNERVRILADHIAVIGDIQLQIMV